MQGVRRRLDQGLAGERPGEDHSHWVPLVVELRQRPRRGLRGALLSHLPRKPPEVFSLEEVTLADGGAFPEEGPQGWFQLGVQSGEAVALRESAQKKDQGYARTWPAGFALGLGDVRVDSARRGLIG